MTKKAGPKSFVLTEILVVIGILSILAIIAVPVFRFFQRENDLKSTSEEIINFLRNAQNKTLASEKASQWGVYFSATNSQYTLFKGPSFISRNPSFDQIKQIPGLIEIYNITFPESEVVFDRISGNTEHYGTLSLRITTDLSKTETVAVEPSGQVTSGQENPADESALIKDSRHTHFDYSRSIDTANEVLTLIFDNSISTDIVIVDNLKDGQIYWEGETEVGGAMQKIKIHSHRLNAPDSQICIHRDRRFNDKSLSIEISGEGTGDLINFTAQGQTAKGNSLYVTEPARQ